MMDFSIFRPQNLSKSEPIYAYKRYAYKKTHVFAYLLFMSRIIGSQNKKGGLIGFSEI